MKLDASGVESSTSRPARLDLQVVGAPHHPYAMHARIARMIAATEATSRNDLARATGIARSTVAEYLAPLVAAGIVRESSATGRGGRGRPARELRLDAAAGVVLVADLGAHHARIALADVGQRLISADAFAIDIGTGPTSVLDQVVGGFDGLLREASTEPNAIRSIVIGLPGPVDFERGVPVKPPIMPGWDGFGVAAYVGERFGTPVLVDNDVNLLALGEARMRAAEQLPLLFIKVSTGIGCGIVLADGTLHRGADGAAGDIGHIRVTDEASAVCRCGNVGCVEAIASGTAIIASVASEREGDVAGLDALARLIAAGDARAIRSVRDASKHIGEVAAILVHIYNPAAIVLGGHVARVSDDLLSGVRAVVYRRALPLATRGLIIANSQLGERAGLVGGLVLAVESALSACSIERLVDAAA